MYPQYTICYFVAVHFFKYDFYTDAVLARAETTKGEHNNNTDRVASLGGARASSPPGSPISSLVAATSATAAGAIVGGNSKAGASGTHADATPARGAGKRGASQHKR